MGAGLRVRLDDGTFQIDGITPIFGLRLYQKVTTAPGSVLTKPGYTNIYCTLDIASITFAATAPVIGFCSPSVPAALLSCVRNANGTWTAQFATWGAATIEVYVFDGLNQFAQPAAGNGLGFGLRVYDGNGQPGQRGNLIADASIPWLKPLSYVSGNLAGSGTANGAQVTGATGGEAQIGYPYPAATDYPTGAIKVASAAVVTPTDFANYVHVGGWQHAGGTATFSWGKWAYSGSGYTADNNFVGYLSMLNWSAMLIDVTGIGD